MAVPAAGNLLYQVFATLYLRGFVLLSGGAWRTGDYSNHDCDEYGSARGKLHWQCPSVYRVAQHDTAVPHNSPTTPLQRFWRVAPTLYTTSAMKFLLLRVALGLFFLWLASL